MSIKLIKKDYKIFVVADKTFSDYLDKILEDLLSVTNKDYSFIQNKFYYFTNLIKRINKELNYDNLSKDEIRQKENQKEQILTKVGNLRRYLDFSSEKICFYNKKEKFFYLGFLKIVQNILKEKNINYEFINDEQESIIDINTDDFDRTYQYEAVKKIISEKIGIIKSPTGSGKTFISEQAIKNLIPFFRKGFGVTFIVEQKDLLLQTKESFPESWQKRIGIIGGGLKQFNNKDILICTIQTLSSLKNKKKTKELYYDICNTTDLLLVDECDMFTSLKRTNIIKDFKKARWRIFLTATPNSRFKDEKNMRLKEVAGEIIFEIKETDLIKQGFLSKQKAIFIKNYNHLLNNKIIIGNKKSKWLNVYDEMIVNSEHRNGLAKQIFLILKKYKLKSIFLVEQEKHGLLLSKNFNIPFYKGANNIYERKQAINDIESGKCNIIITTRIFQRAVNIPELQVIVNMAGYKSDSKITQLKGRISRKTKGKNKSMYIDFFDYGNKYLEDHSEERLKTMKLLEVPVINIYIEKLRKKIKKFFIQKNGDKKNET